MRPWRNVRGRLLLIVLAALAVALAAATVAFNVLYAHATVSNADALLRARSNTELSVLFLRNGRVRSEEVSPDALADSLVWIFDRQGIVERPAKRTSLDAAAASLAGGPERFLADASGTEVRLHATPIVLGGERRGTLVTGISTEPYEQTAHTAFVWSVALAVALLAAVGIAVFFLLRSALRPVALMTRQAASWSEDELDRRFDVGEPHDELTQLGATLDGLLDRIAASLRRERSLTAEMSHELRTPLARMIGEAELALRRERTSEEYRAALEGIMASPQRLTGIVEALVAAARQEAGAPRGTADAYAVVAKTVDGFRGIEGVTVVAEPPSVPVRVGVDAELAERVLHPVIENACRYGRSLVRVTVRRESGRVMFAVEDDGPGIEADEREAIFAPGTRGRAGRGVPGAGLGLALARRLARSASGDVSAEPARTGARLLVTLPTA